MNFEEKSKELLELHKKIKFVNGTLTDEFPEQVMSLMFLTGKEKVLELGGNVGRNSMIIAYILNQCGNTDYVTFETNAMNAQALAYNKYINDFKFHIENAGISSKKLIQFAWDTIPSDVVLPGYYEVNTLTWAQVKEKYKIDFDTLILDCEGAFYYILKDTPEILNNIKLIITENDYMRNPTHKDFVQDTLKNTGFECIFTHPLIEPYDIPDFYQVWKKKI